MKVATYRYGWLEYVDTVPEGWTLDRVVEHCRKNLHRFPGAALAIVEGPIKYRALDSKILRLVWR